MMDSIFGYFNSVEQDVPVFDPGLSVICPFCLLQLEPPLKTISFMALGSERSYFYRAHKGCYESADQPSINEIESSVVDSAPLTGKE